MKKEYTSPDLELFAVRPDEQIASTCLFVNNVDHGYSCWWDPDSHKMPPGEYTLTQGS